MGIKDIFFNLKEKILSLFSKISSFFKNDRKQAIIISSLSCLVLVLVIILCCSLSGKKTKSKQIQNVITLTEKPLIPTSPEIQENYTLSRKSQDKWTEEETDEWFTVPSQKDIDSLSITNDNLVSDIIEAAP